MNPLTAPQRILISGASGLIGRALIPLLKAEGHTVLRLVRRPAAGPDEICWNPERGELDAAALGEIQAVIHLAGENVAGGRWTTRRKTAILQSRVASTRLLVSAMVSREVRPQVFVSASATGYYGDRGDERLDETSAPGEGFLAEVCRAWESELVPAVAAGIRTVALRTGVVLTPRGGALDKMLPAFRCGLGGRLGSGRQWLSWIALDDMLGVILHALRKPEMHGPLNAVAPGAVTNAEFTATLARVLRRPTGLPVPAFALRLLFGEMADATLLASTRVAPAQLQRLGFDFKFSQLEPALRHLLASPPAK
jgi:uncharacterized protein (TIGR01777 family)